MTAKPYPYLYKDIATGRDAFAGACERRDGPLSPSGASKRAA